MIDPAGGFTHERYCELVGEAVDTFVEVVRGLDPAMPIPTCPGWTLAKLVRHTGTVHRWATVMVSTSATERVDPKTLALALPDDDRWLPGWLAAGRDPLVDALAAADPDVAMWAWGADQHTRFWPRRMLHETTVHRVDAEGVAKHTEIAADVAADAIDEFFTNLPPSAAFSPDVAELHGEGTLGFVALDRALGSGARWIVTLGAEAFDVRRAEGREAEDADVCASGPPDQVLLLLYGRLDAPGSGLTVAGDQGLLDWWQDHSALT